MKCSIYVRVSTEKQADRGYSLEAQRKAGIKICHSNKWSYEVFPEPGRSADKETIENRPSLMKILDLAEEGKIQYCFVTEIDRLSRNPVSLGYVKKIFADNNVKIVTLNQTFDLEDYEDDFISDLQGLLAKRSNKARVVRIKRAKSEAVLKGRWPFGLMPYGYTKDKDNKLIPHPRQSKIYKLMVEWYLAGISTRKIAIKLNRLSIKSPLTEWAKNGREYKWTSRTTHRILTNPFYKGEFCYKGHHNKVTSLIAEETWNKVQKKIKDNRRYSGRPTKNFYLLKDLLVCKKCGRKLYGARAPKNYAKFYYCSSKVPSPLPRPCGLKNVNLDKIDNLVWDTIKRLIKSPQALREAVKAKQVEYHTDKVSLERQLKLIEKNIDSKSKKIDRLLDLYSKSQILDPAELDKKVLQIKQEREALIEDREKLLKNAAQVTSARENLKHVEQYAAKIKDRLDSFDDNERYDFLHLLIDKALVDYHISGKDKKGKPTGQHTLEIQGAVPILEDEYLEEYLEERPVLENRDTLSRMRYNKC